MEQHYEYVSVPIPPQLFSLLAAYGDALGIPHNWALVHLAIYGAGGDALGSADMSAYEELRSLDTAFLSMATRAFQDGVKTSEAPF